MNSLAVAVLLVAVAYTSASAVIAGPAALGYAHTSARGALEGALGGQWIPDVPVAAPHAAVVASPYAAIAASPYAAIAAPAIAAPLGIGLAGHGVVASRGALEGALGGQWIPDTHGK